MLISCCLCQFRSRWVASTNAFLVEYGLNIPEMMTDEALISIKTMCNNHIDFFTTNVIQDELYAYNE